MGNGIRPKWAFQLSDAATQQTHTLDSLGSLILFLEQAMVAEEGIELLFEPKQTGDYR